MNGLRRIRFASLALGAVAFGCGSEVTRPSGPAIVISRLTLRSNQPINLPVTDSIALGVAAMDQQGKPFSPGSGYFTWRSNPAVGAVVGDVFRATASPGVTWVVAETPGGLRDSVLVSTYRGTGTFHITLQYAADIPARWRIELEKAARRWEATMTGDLPPVTLSSPGADCGRIPGEPPSPPETGVERGVRIYVGQVSGITRDTWVEAVGGPCLQRPLPSPTTILGQITLNRDKPVSSIDSFRLGYLALHEMGHVLGLVGVVQGLPPSWFDNETLVFTGALGLEGWRREVGTVVTSLATKGAHWRTTELFDIMGAGGGGPLPVPPISLVSIGALMDMGYPARWEGAGPYDAMPRVP